MEYPCTKGKPSFTAKNTISPTDAGKKKNAPLQMSLFGDDALKSDLPASPKYAKKGKGGTVNTGVAKSKPNQISPDANY